MAIFKRQLLFYPEIFIRPGLTGKGRDEAIHLLVRSLINEWPTIRRYPDTALLTFYFDIDLRMKRKKFKAIL
jgi:hypothetical protein